MTIAAILGQKGAEVFSVTSDVPLGRIIAILAEHRVGALPVVGDGQVRGVISERDVIRLLAQADVPVAEVMAMAVGAVMTTPTLTVSPDDSVLAALSLMTHRRIRHLPVVADGRIRGIVSIGDLVKYRIDRIESDAAAMRDYIQRA